MTRLRMRRAGWTLAAALLTTTSSFAIATTQAQAQAQEQGQRYNFNVTSKPVPRAVNDIGRITGYSIVFVENTPITSAGNAVRGNLTVDQALSLLLAGTGLDYRFSNSTTLQIFDPASEGQSQAVYEEDGSIHLGTILVRKRLLYSGAIDGYLASVSETGVKSGVPLSEVPQSISVVTSTELNARQPSQIEDAIKYTAGVNASTWGTDDRYDQFAIRGFDLGTSSIYRDGLPQKSLSFTSFNTDPYMIERIDVLRGPAGILYGSNDAGGMINLATKRPTFDRLAEVNVSYGSNNTKSTAFDWSDTINEKGTLAGRLTGKLRDGETEFENSANDRAFLAGGLTWAPTDQTVFTILGHIQRDSLTPLNMFPVAGEDYDTSWGRLPNDWPYKQSKYNHFKTEQQSLGWELTHEFSPEITFNHRLRYAHQTTDYAQLDYYGADAAGVYYYPFIVDNDAETFGTDSNIKWKHRFGSAENSLVVGYDYQNSRNNETVHIDYTTYLIGYNNPSFDFAVTDPALSEHRRTTYVESGIYLQNHLKFDSGTSLTLGLRRTQMENKIEDLLNNTANTQDNSATTGMVGITHKFDNGLSPYLSYTEGFVQNVGKTINGNVLDPSESNQWEVGLRYKPTDDLLLSAAFFDLHKTNVKDYDLNDPTFSSFTQAGEIQSRGIELEARGRLSSTLQGTASYTYLQTEITQSSNSSQLGNENAMAPNHQASLWLDYDASGLLPGLTIGAGVRYVSDAYSTQDNLRTTPSYTLADLSLLYEVDGYAVKLGVTNLFDREYYGVCYDGYACANGEGRMAKLSLTSKF